MTIPKLRREIARAIANHLENNPLLVDDLHAEMASRSMTPLTDPIISEDLASGDSDTVKNYLEADDMVAVDADKLEKLAERLEDANEPLAELIDMMENDEDTPEDSYKIVLEAYQKSQSWIGDIAAELENMLG